MGKDDKTDFTNVILPPKERVHFFQEESLEESLSNTGFHVDASLGLYPTGIPKKENLEEPILQFKRFAQEINCSFSTLSPINLKHCLAPVVLTTTNIQNSSMIWQFTHMYD